MRRAWFGLAMLVIAACAPAPTIDDARIAGNSGDHETALRIARELAAQGHSGAHYLIGIAYAKGEGVAQDFDEADRWFARYVEMRKGKPYLARARFENTEESVASYYDNADFGLLAQVVNTERALIWYERSAAAGSARALRRLGHLHRLGRGVPKDAAKALAYYRRAAEAGDAYSFSLMGALYLSDELGAPDPARAREALVEGIENGDAFSAEELGRMHLDGMGGEKNPQLARGWWIVAAKSGNMGGALNLARLYLRREIAARDWRVRGLMWGLVANNGGLFGDDRIARMLASEARVAAFSDEELRAARRLANAFIEIESRSLGAELPAGKGAR